jgi:hypothetical protein
MESVPINLLVVIGWVILVPFVLRRLGVPRWANVLTTVSLPLGAAAGTLIGTETPAGVLLAIALISVLVALAARELTRSDFPGPRVG